MMTRHAAVWTFLVLALAACSAGDSDAPPDVPAETPDAPAAEAVSAEAAVEALREDWVTHYNLHHPDMVADFYTEGAWVLHADQAVHEGREAVATWLTATMENDPTATITTREILVFGDRAVTMGTYSVNGSSPEGETVAFAGHYMNLVSRVDGEWLIDGSITNYDAPRPEGWAWADTEGDPPPEDGTMTELVEAYETHWNLQHPDMVADLYAEDAVAAFADGPVLEGRAAIAARMQEVVARGATLDVHDVGTIDLDESHRLDAGWFEMTSGEGGEPVQVGMYMLLAELQGDGSWAITRMITNARPMAAPMP